jgi:hypothetical protein
MNWRRGLFRLWLVFSILFVIGTAAVFYRDVRSEFEETARTWPGHLLVPVACSDARGKAGIDYEVFDDPSTTIKCWYQVPKLRTLYPEYNDLTNDDLSNRLYKKAGLAMKETAAPWTSVLKVIAIAIGGPLIILVVGAALMWSLAGFAVS